MSKITFIATVFNDKKGIDLLLDSLSKQVVKPDEVIIVDAGSKDGTLNSIKKFSQKLPLKVFRKKGNRSIGRNFAISKSRGDIIAASDAGCILDKHWLERITKPFSNRKIDVVAGFYKPVVKNSFEKSLAAYTCYPEDKVDGNFLPSSRSIAFKKKTWQDVGGYPENLDTCEDLFFAKSLKEKGFRFRVKKDALVYWPQRENVISAAKQFYGYAVGDGKALYVRSQTPLLFIRYFLGVVLMIAFIYFGNILILYFAFLLFSFYILWSILKNFDYVNHISALFYLPFLQLVSDIMVIIGFVVGFGSRVWDTRK